MDAHGGDVYSRRIRWDFSANVNPLGTPEGVKEAVRRSAEDCCRYPDPRCRRLKRPLERFIKSWRIGFSAEMVRRI